MKPSVDENILTIDKNICKNINKNKDDRGFLSQNILNNLRNLVEHIALKIYNQDNNVNLTDEFENLQTSIKYVKTKAKFKNLADFHRFLQIAVSHYMVSEENAERLMIKYYVYLLQIKKLMEDDYGLNILHNLSDFQYKFDTLEQEYYKVISVTLERYTNITKINTTTIKDDVYYIKDIKPFVINKNIYYEVSFTIASDNVSKFDKVLAFTKLDIMSNYATRLYVIDTHINFLNRRFPIKIITNWHIDIRPCEITNFCKIIKLSIQDIRRTELYSKFMKYLTQQRLTLVELIELDDGKYKQIEQYFSKDKLKIFFDCLNKCRQIIKGKSRGENILRYLLCSLNNKIIKNQFCNKQNNLLSKLYLEYGSIPFDDMPFVSSPIGHNPKLCDLLECINIDGRMCELFARRIKNNAEMEGILYNSIEDVKSFEKDDIDKLIDAYNQKLYSKHLKRKIHKLGNGIFYIKEYEDNILTIIREMDKFAQSGIDNYQENIKVWFNKANVDCPDKKRFLSNLFINSKVGLIYGSAGTGKTTMIEHISNFFTDKSKLYLTNTNTALTNLKLRIKMPNVSFMTIASFVESKSSKHHSILFIDECSTISNSDMKRILEKTSCEILICVGDIFQIESIRFGNWFALIQRFLSGDRIVELKTPYRTQDKKLIALWNSVRNLEDNMAEVLINGSYSESLDKFDFSKSKVNNDEIILCLNYGGIYGINNINRVLQENNNNQSFIFKGLIYKKGDPILFNETKRFTNEIHNNLKGTILDIEELEKGSLKFVIEVDKILIEKNDSFEIVKIKDNKTIVSFKILNYNTDNDDDDNVMPFQIAYAISIHKAQGLEYDNVNIVISNEIEEQITHNIFYTAITRARKDLKIFWSPETQNKILNSMSKKDMGRDYSIIKNKLSYQ